MTCEKRYRFDDTVQGEIEDFLGPDILSHPLVRGSILTDEEKIKLDRELEITELDTALDQSNLKSSPGMDGFSYKYIKKFWNIYREPLYSIQLCKKIFRGPNSPRHFFDCTNKINTEKR